MAENNAPAAENTPPTAELSVRAATLAELREACTGAPADFLLQQLENEATETVALKAWNAELVAQAKAAAEAEPTPQPVAQPGTPALNSVGGESAPAASADAVAEWAEAIDEQQKKHGCDRMTAAAKARKANPELATAARDACFA